MAKMLSPRQKVEPAGRRVDGERPRRRHRRCGLRSGGTPAADALNLSQICVIAGECRLDCTESASTAHLWAHTLLPRPPRALPSQPLMSTTLKTLLVQRPARDGKSRLLGQSKGAIQGVGTRALSL